MKAKLLLQIVLIVLVMVSCEAPLDPIVKSVNNTTALLQRHVWNLEEFTVKVRDEDIPPPVLFSDTNPVNKGNDLTLTLDGYMHTVLAPVELYVEENDQGVVITMEVVDQNEKSTYLRFY
jgi:hypothetical protein